MASYSGHESSCSDADLDFSGKFGYNKKCFYFVYCPFPITQVYKHALHVIKMHYILYVTDENLHLKDWLTYGNERLLLTLIIMIYESE